MKVQRLIFFLLFCMIALPLTICRLHAQDRPYFWPARFQFQAGNDPRDIVIGDFNEDGLQDLAAADNDGGRIAILTGEGNGFFSDPVFYASGAGAGAILVGDFDEDGNQDLAVHDSGISIFFGEGGGLL